MTSGIVLNGGVSYQINPTTNTVRLSVAEIDNDSATITTGTLRLELWLTTSPWNYSGSNSGWEVATDQISNSSNGTLAPGQDLSAISGTFGYINHPSAGTYYVTLAVAEYSGASPSVDNGFVIDAATTFANLLVVSGGGSLSQGGSTAPAGPPVVAVQNETLSAGKSIQASSLITSTADPNGYAITGYAFYDEGGSGGSFALNGVTQSSGTWITINAATLSHLTFVAGSSGGTETVAVEINDGYNWSNYQTATITTQATSPPVLSLQSASVKAGNAIPASSLIASVSDPNGYAITNYSFNDEGGGAGYFTLNGARQTGGTWITVSAANLSQLSFVAKSSGGSDSIAVEAYDGHNWSVFQTTTVTTQSLSLPAVTAQDQTVNAGGSIQASQLIASTYDPNGYAITSYAFYDEGGDGGSFSLNGVTQSPGSWITVSSAKLSQLTFLGGSVAGSETVAVDIYDGQNWANYQTATITTEDPSLPVVNVQNQTVTAGKSIAAASLITSVSDPNGYPITTYSFYDNGGSAGYFVLNGVRQAAGGWISVSAAKLSQLSFVAGSSIGTDVVDVAVWDGHNWGGYQSATITTSASQTLVPTIVLQNQTVSANAAIQASSLIVSVTDPNNLSITSYGFLDQGSGGYFTLSGAKQAAATELTVVAADLSKVQYVGAAAAGSELVIVQVTDSQGATSYQTATVSTTAAGPPVVTPQNQQVNENASVLASSLVSSVYDPNNLSMTAYQFRDDGGGSGYFTLNGIKEAAGSWISVSTANLAQLSFVGGASPGSDTVEIEAYNGQVWSAATAATIITKAPQTINPPVVTTQNQTVTENASIQASSLIASVSDPNHIAITYYGFYDAGGGAGTLSLSGVKQSPGSWVTVSAANLAQLIYVGGNATGKETINVEVYDGYNWSTSASATVTTTVPQYQLPVITVQNQAVGVGATIQAASLVASVSDPNNFAISSYDFRDDGGSGGYFTLNGVKQGTASWITVTAANLSQLSFAGAATAGSETVDVAAWDGHNWSTYQTATVTAQASTLPQITVQNQTVSNGQSIAASTLVAAVSDPGNLAITEYQFRDDGGSGGAFSLNGATQATGGWIDVTAANLSQLSFVGAAAAGIETVDVKAFDGHNWSNFATATVTTIGSNGNNPVVALLTSPGIKADAATLITNNTLTYSGMLKILQDVAAGGTVTASELTDLKTIVSYFNKSGGITVSPYLYDISNKLVNGDPANASWNGGGASVALGNLAVGSSQTQLNELIQKWFLGGDMPNPVFDGTGTISYRADSNALYNTNGTPVINDINQGSLGDCYLLASLAEVANCEPTAIKSMITDNGNGSYGIRFYINGQATYETVNDMLPVYTSSGALCGNSSTAIWSCLVEKAYVQLNAEPGATDHQTGNEYLLIDGGWADPITAVTGRKIISYYYADYTTAQWTNLKTTIATAIQNNMEVDFASDSETTVNGKTAFVSGHMYSGIGYDSTTGNFIIRNPWGTESGQYWNTTFEASMADLAAVQGELFVATATAAAAPAAASAVTGTASSIVTQFLSGQLTTAVAINDSAANIQASLDSLQSIAKSGLLTAITLTDSGSPTLSVTGAQLANDATALQDIAGNYTVAVTGTTTAATLNQAILNHIGSVRVADSAANVAANLDSIEAYAAAGKLAGIALTDGGTPILSVTSTQLVVDAVAINAISGNYTLTVPGVAAPIATFLLQQDSAGRGANGIALDYSGTAPAGGNSVIGFQSASFTSGSNAVILNGPRSSYAIQIAASGATTIKDIGVGDAAFGQTVTVTGESYILFNGANLNLSASNSAAALITPPGSTTAVLSYPNDILFVLSQANAQLAQFYSSLLSWEPQPALAGFEYWVTQLNGGMSLTAIAQSFINTSYFQQTFGDPGTTHTQHQAYVELLYSHILGMSLGANEAGVLYWTNAMDGGMSGASALISFTDATATASTINAMSGTTAGGGVGWLIDPSLTGGYADPGAQITAQTVLTQAASSHFYNLSLIDPASVGAGGVSANGITVTPGAVQVAGTAASGTVVVLSPSFAQATVSGSGYTLHDGLGSDRITVTGAGNTLFLGSATTDSLTLAFGTNTTIAGFTPGHGSLLAVSGTVNETTVSLLDGTTTKVLGSGLNFGTASAASAIVVAIGSIGDGSATAVATAANTAYAVADVTGNAATGALGEHLVFIGTNSGGDAEIWAFKAPLTTVTANGQAVQVPITGADTGGTHLVTAGEITLIATLIGVPASSLAAADLA